MLSVLSPMLLSAISSTLLASGITYAAPMQSYAYGGSSSAYEHPDEHYYGSGDQLNEGDADQGGYYAGDQQGQLQAEPKKLVFFSSDGKVDDNLAIALAGYTQKYDDAHIFHDGITDHHASMLNTEHLQRHLEHTVSPHIHLNKIHYVGDTPLTHLKTGKPLRQDHENFFHDDGTLPTAEQGGPQLLHPDDLHFTLSYHEGQGKKADFFSQSPVPMETLRQRLQAIKEHGIELETFHHILGYNTRQDSVSKARASAKTQAFATSLQSMVHEYFPNCKVIITNSYLNLGGAAGATQPFGELEKILPRFGLDAIGPLDTFFLNQMNAATEALIKAGFMPRLFLGATGEPITQAEIWQARRNANPNDLTTQKLRSNIIQAAQHDLEWFDYMESQKEGTGRNMAARMRSIIRGIQASCQGEACDFNHQALVHAADIKHKMGYWPYKPMKLGENIMSGWADHHQESHGVSPDPDLGLQYGTTQWYLNEMIGTSQDKETERFNPYKKYVPKQQSGSSSRG